MQNPQILLVDDNPLIKGVVQKALSAENYDVQTASTGSEALARIAANMPNLILLDVFLPDMDGRSVCQKIREKYPGIFLPIILISGMGSSEPLIEALAAGANDFISKPFNWAQLIAKIRSFVGVKKLYDGEREKAFTLEEENRDIENRWQFDLSRLNRIKKFLSPHVADLVMSSSEVNNRRKDITVVFFDLRGFTRFVERFTPDEVIAVLNEYYRAVGTEVLRYQGTIGCIAGDGIMSFFNDPVEIPNHLQVATEFALTVRDTLSTLKENWDQKGYGIDFGAGLSSGEATIGVIGFEGYWDYAAIGAVSNLASRLCGRAFAGQILTTEKEIVALRTRFECHDVGETDFKGFPDSVRVFDIVAQI